ncbi:MAG: hypothetical protein MJ229_04570 [bacterium]|nr:hypothetical protein [bacterium]
MGLNIAYNQTTLDAKAVQDVTKQILRNAETQNSALANADLSKFNRVSLGKDLYKVNAAQASEIAMANSNININLSDKAQNSLKYLSALASTLAFKKVKNEVKAEEKAIVETKRPSFGKLTEAAESKVNPFIGFEDEEEILIA